MTGRLNWYCRLGTAHQHVYPVGIFDWHRQRSIAREHRLRFIHHGSEQEHTWDPDHSVNESSSNNGQRIECRNGILAQEIVATSKRELRAVTFNVGIKNQKRIAHSRSLYGGTRCACVRVLPQVHMYVRQFLSRSGLGLWCYCPICFLCADCQSAWLCKNKLNTRIF